VALLSEQDADFIRKHFEGNLTGDVAIDYFTQRESKLIVPGLECMYCRETRQLLEEVAELSPKVALNVHDFVGDAEAAAADSIERIPAFTIKGNAKGAVRYFGIPSGYEFSSLIEDIVDVSKGTTDLSAPTLEALAGLKDQVHIQVFVTPT
jgi:alkyl hydroperoxide reductase subunit AhpF